eukprot:CAMPEP_0197645794 /NCGR_PEP_ID=MMETSP1338-20131121/20641_1 /TAXON_ID=43686 ORGANISM="Pelagodinium beii, Strain RCC1491" /NCGR_SAMPLE_ID=MMETSP1338 /ASSEMBLY_ACC=CAM_ASM_000754 /LENGTH=52 /DNA_ID=CAMNT_0043219349 /DNA_START=17 /DNA_END=172 /DNA_ORIENTATION=-
MALAFLAASPVNQDVKSPAAPRTTSQLPPPGGAFSSNTALVAGLAAVVGLGK